MPIMQTDFGEVAALYVSQSVFHVDIFEAKLIPVLCWLFYTI